MSLKDDCKAQKLKRQAEKKRQVKAKKALREKSYRKDKVISTMRERLASEKSKRLAVLTAVNKLIELNLISDAGHSILMEELHDGRS